MFRLKSLNSDLLYLLVLKPYFNKCDQRWWARNVCFPFLSEGCWLTVQDSVWFLQNYLGSAWATKKERKHKLIVVLLWFKQHFQHRIIIFFFLKNKKSSYLTFPLWLPLVSSRSQLAWDTLGFWGAPNILDVVPCAHWSDIQQAQLLSPTPPAGAASSPQTVR